MHMQLSTIVYRYSSLIECCLSWMNLFISGVRYSKSNKMLSFIVQVQQKSKPPTLKWPFKSDTLFERSFILFRFDMFVNLCFLYLLFHQFLSYFQIWSQSIRCLVIGSGLAKYQNRTLFTIFSEKSCCKS